MAQITGSFEGVKPHTVMRSRPSGRATRAAQARSLRYAQSRGGGEPLDVPVVVSLVLGLVGSIALASFVYFSTREAVPALGVLAAGAAAVLLGAALGSAVWPTLGVHCSHAILAIYARLGRARNAQLLLTPYPDFVPGRARQTWESTAFAGGLALLMGVNGVILLAAPPGALPWLSLGGLAISCAMTFLLVPHWMFARLGLRLSQQGRFVVTSVAESYSRLVRVSNGTLLLVATFYGITVLLGRSARIDAYLTVATTLGVLLLLAVITMATATAFFRRHEREVCRRIAQEAKRVGFVGVTAGRVASI